MVPGNGSCLQGVLSPAADCGWAGHEGVATLSTAWNKIPLAVRLQLTEELTGIGGKTTLPMKGRGVTGTEAPNDLNLRVYLLQRQARREE